MRKFLIPLTAAASTLAFAAPASAQWYPQPRHGYSNYGHNIGQARALQVRLNHIQREIARLAQYRMISPAEYRRLRNESRQIERRIRHDMRDGRGLDRREVYNLQRRIARLEYRLARNVRDGRRYAYGPGWRY